MRLHGPLTFVRLLAGLAVVAAAGLLAWGTLAEPARAYVIPDGSAVYWICPGPRNVVAVTRLNKAAGNPFGAGPAGTLSQAIYDARYGVRPDKALCGGSNPTFRLYAEETASYLQGRMYTSCLGGDPLFIDQQQWDCWPGPNRGQGPSIEVEDYAAVIGVTPGSTGAVSATPGTPAIKSISSPRPGAITLSWQTRPNHSWFLLRAKAGLETFEARAPGGPATQYTTTIELPSGMGGDVEVVVLASLGGATGPPSGVQRVFVEPRVTPHTTPTPTPTPTATPTPDPSPTPTPPATHCDGTAVAQWPEFTTLTAAWQAFLARLASCRP